jgi:DNA-binding HxlR family transcriptional regulator
MNLNSIDIFFKSKFDKEVSAGKMALMAGRKSYNQNCPIAKGLDILGERWTLLILRELLAGPRRYSDLRAELPGIATNLLAERLKELEKAGLVDRAELPPPIARTVYTLSDAGWQRVLPVLQSLARFGLDRIDSIDSGPVSPLTGFLALIVVPFDPIKAAGTTAAYRVDIDGRRFEFALDQGRLAGARGEPDVTVTASAADLANARLGSTEAKRKAALRRIKFHGEPDAIDILRVAFSL